MKRAIDLTLLILLVIMAGCATAPVQPEPIIPARRSMPEQEVPREQQGFYGLGAGPYLVLPIFGPSNLRDTGGLAVDSFVYSLMMRQLIAELGMDDSDEDALYWGLTGLAAIDQRHLQSFRYFMTGSPFEYTFIRKLYKVQRDFLIDN